MTLVDTAVWIDHFRASLPALVRMLHDGEVAGHVFVVGELVLGHLRRREETVALLAELPTLKTASHDDLLRFVGKHALAGTGVGWIDAHLLCAAASAGVPLWTHDRALRKQAARLGLAPGSAIRN
ncbi:MAG: PIN domain-containing protein [Vicinamibacterales bacterium]